MNTIKWIANDLPKTADKNLSLLSTNEAKKVRVFHESFPQYQMTPLANLDHLATHLGLKNIYVKDESYRFGLNAFKVLGGSYAMAKYIADTIGNDVSELPYSVLTSDALKKELGAITFFTATDGNHGRGVAWAANKLKQNCVIYMPIGTTQTRLDHILSENAKATIEELNYDDCVRKASAQADATENGVIVQDTAWDGYEKIPTWIMQGYGTMALEADEQLGEYGCDRPTHIFIQAGVGSLAGAVQGYFANRYAGNEPIVVVVEAEVAACLYKGAVAGDGDIRTVGGDMLTLMNGLACGEPSTISWDILRNHVHTFVSCPDWVTAKGMRVLAAPLKGDVPVTAGESGAVTTGLLYHLMKDDHYKELRDHLKLDENSKVLLFSTEGDTDPNRYQSIVWDGESSL
ncbi:MAG: diaminopropionate ammonia-lyase [Lachnospiraceae bacterium]